MTIRQISLVVALIAVVAVGTILTHRPTGESSQQNPSVSSPAQDLAPSVTVDFTRNGFVPERVTIRQGQIVRFTTTAGKPFWPASDIHPTHQIYPEFDPKRPIPFQESWSFRFDKIGAWRFHNHLDASFTGTIVVTP